MADDKKKKDERVPLDPDDQPTEVVRPPPMPPKTKKK